MEMSLRRRVVLQNKMALDIIIALQGGTCVIIQTECYVLLLNQSANVLSLLNHMRTDEHQSELTPSLGDLINQCFRS